MDRALTCKTCGWTTNGGTGAMNRHVAKWHEGKKWECELCGKEFDDKYIRNRHQDSCKRPAAYPASVQVVTVIEDMSTVTCRNTVTVQALPVPALPAPAAAPPSD